MRPKENKAFTQKLINRLENDGFEKDPMFGLIMVDWLKLHARLGIWNGLLVIRHTDDNWHVSVGLVQIRK